MKIFVVVATVGRAELTRKTVDLLADQTRPADGVVVVSVSPSDVEGVEKARGNPLILFAERGLCRQRNRALKELEGKADVIIFFDDDFVPAANYIEETEKLFNSDATIVGSTGELVADGIHTGGFDFDHALAEVEEKAATLKPFSRTRRALYGCNMAIRMSAAHGLAFDETLPLYGWQEDIDYTCQLGWRGRLVSTTKITGVHMGAQGARTPGRKLGYSQIANIVYLLRKGTLPPGLGEKLIFRNVTANMVRSLKPEAHIDRRGRLAGNFLAMVDYLRGRIDPRRIETM